MKLKNKVAIVTGGGRDIGRSISIKLAREGAKVAINYFNSETEAQETLDIVTREGGEAMLIKGDMTRAEDVSRLVSVTQNTFGSDIHILVNVTGGIIARKKLEEMDENFVNSLMKLNVNSVFLAMQAVVPFMPAGSSIINLSSQAARDGGGPGASGYAMSKGAVTTFSRAMAKELGPRNIRVNALCPGMISTLFHDTFSTPQARTNVAASTPLRREGHPDEIGDVVAYLASSEASFLTGLNLDANGGLLMS